MPMIIPTRLVDVGGSPTAGAGGGGALRNLRVSPGSEAVTGVLSKSLRTFIFLIPILAGAPVVPPNIGEEVTVLSTDRETHSIRDRAVGTWPATHRPPSVFRIFLSLFEGVCASFRSREIRLIVFR